MDELHAVLREIQAALREQSRGISELASAATRLAEIPNYLREQGREISALSDGVTRLVRAIEQEDRLRDRVERSEEKERDERHAQLEEALSELKERVENVGKASRELPTRLAEAVAARWNSSSNDFSEPPPLPPPPSYREPTGRHRQLPPHLPMPLPETTHEEREHTGVFARDHVDGSPRELRDIIGGVAIFLWRRGAKWAAAVGGGTGLWHLLHKLHIL
jgi:hypothetical protein